MATYYARSDGTAANKEAATSDSTAATSMNEAVFNGETFGAGDVIYLSGLGGDFSNLTFTDSGAANSSITIAGANSAKIVTATSAAAFAVTAIEWVNFQDFDLESTYTAGAATALFAFNGACGAASNESVNVANVNALANEDGDAFSQISAGSGHVNFTNCDASDIGTTGESHQAFTSHTATHSMVVTDGTITNCVNAIVNVGGSLATFNNVTITGCRGAVAGGGGGSRTILNNCNITLNDANAKLWSTTGVDYIEYNDCDTTITETSEQLLQNAEHIYFQGGTFNYNASTFRIRTLGSGGNLSFLGVDVTCGSSNVYTFYQGVSDAGKFTFKGNTFNGALQDVGDALFGINGTADIEGNIFNGFLLTNFGGKALILETVVGGATTVNICNNVFYGGVSHYRDIRTVLGSTRTWNIGGNIFVNNTDSIDDLGSVATISYNCYFNAGDDGGTGSITSDPLFVDAASGDFRLQLTEDGYAADSPCRDTAIRTWTGANPIGYDGEPIADYPVSMGAWQHKYNSNHPVNL